MVSWDNTQFTLKKSVFGAEYFSDDSMNNKKNGGNMKIEMCLKNTNAQLQKFKRVKIHKAK